MTTSERAGERPPLEPEMFTTAQVCELANISMSTYYKLRRAGLGPREWNFPKMKMVRVAKTEFLKWMEQLEALQNGADLRLEAQRRRASSAHAGRISGEVKRSRPKRRHR